MVRFALIDSSETYIDRWLSLRLRTLTAQSSLSQLFGKDLFVRLGGAIVTKSQIIAVLILCFSLGACDDVGLSSDDKKSQTSGDFDYVRNDATDEFSSIVKSVASASFPRKGLNIDVKVTCERNQNHVGRSRLNLTAVMVGKKDGNVIQETGAILYKVDDRNPQIYRDDLFDGILPNGSIDLDLNAMGVSSNPLPENLSLRFVVGGSILAMKIGDIDQLSRFPKIDLKIPVRTSSVGKVVSDCFQPWNS